MKFVIAEYGRSISERKGVRGIGLKMKVEIIQVTRF